MKSKRIRQINILELDQALYNSTYEVGLEMTNWLNASMHVCMLESFETKSLKSHLSQEKSAKNFVEEIINDVLKKEELFNHGVSYDYFDENQPIRDIFNKLSADESLSVLGYNKSTKHKEVLKKILTEDLETLRLGIM